MWELHQNWFGKIKRFEPLLFIVLNYIILLISQILLFKYFGAKAKTILWTLGTSLTNMDVQVILFASLIVFLVVKFVGTSFALLVFNIAKNEIVWLSNLKGCNDACMP